MGWKLLGVMNVIIAMVAVFGPGSRDSLLAAIAVAMTIPAAAGVFLYAHAKRVDPRFWRVFSWLFAADSVGIVTYFIMRSIDIGSRHDPVLLTLVLAFIIGCQYFTWLALHRLGQGLTRPVPENAARGTRVAELVAEAAKEHPRRAKVAAWCLMIALCATAPLIVWHEISEGKTYRLIMPAIVGLIIAIRLHMAARKAHEGQ